MRQLRQHFSHVTTQNKHKQYSHDKHRYNKLPFKHNYLKIFYKCHHQTQQVVTEPEYDG